MVVAVGLTLIDPLAAVDVNVPGVIAIVVAPDDVQLSVLPPPGLMLDGLAAKAEIAGIAPFPVDEFDDPEPQPLSPAQPARMMTNRPHAPVRRSVCALRLPSRNE